MIVTLGKHRLIHGDASDFSAIKKLINDEHINLILTDLPYGTKSDVFDFSRLNSLPGEHLTSSRSYRASASNTFNPKFIDTIDQIKADETILFGANYFLDYIQPKNRGAWFVWDKSCAPGKPPLKKRWTSDFELILSYKKHRQKIYRCMWNGAIGMAKIDHPRRHPHQKPVRLLRQLIEDYTQPGGVVLDITGGIGSTLLACELSGRKCLICEIDKEYYELMIKRYHDLVSK